MITPKTPEEKAKNNTLNIVRKLKQLQLESPANANIEYRLGGLIMGYEAELKILNTLEAKGFIQILKSEGSNSNK